LKCIRKCIICGKYAQKDIFFCFRLFEGKIFKDNKKEKRGKGLYICKNELCMNSLLTDKKYKKKYLNYMDDEFLLSIKGCDVYE